MAIVLEPSFRARRTLSILVTALALLVMGSLVWIEPSRSGRVSHVSGYALLTSVFLLMLIGLRRRLPVLPLGRMSTWTQTHLYLGLFTLGLYGMHVPTLIGRGIFEGTLSVLFLVAAGSGIYGLYVSRVLPRRLTATQGQHRLDHVGSDRHKIAETADQLFAEFSERQGSDCLGSYYKRTLYPFFHSRPSLAYMLLPRGWRRERLLQGLRELDRDLGADERTTAEDLSALVRRRDDLDYHVALQWRLRLWVPFHAMVSLALFAGAIVHGVLAWRLSG